HVKRSFYVDLVGVNRIFHGTRHGGARRKVNDVVGGLHRFANGFKVGDAALDEGNLAANFGEIVLLARRQVVEDYHRLAAADQFVHRVRSDKSGSASYHVAHLRKLLSFSRVYGGRLIPMSAHLFYDESLCREF